MFADTRGRGRARLVCFTASRLTAKLNIVCQIVSSACRPGGQTLAVSLAPITSPRDAEPLVRVVQPSLQIVHLLLSVEASGRGRVEGGGINLLTMIERAKKKKRKKGKKTTTPPPKKTSGGLAAVLLTGVQFSVSPPTFITMSSVWEFHRGPVSAADVA